MNKKHLIINLLISSVCQVGFIFNYLLDGSELYYLLFGAFQGTQLFMIHIKQMKRKEIG